MNADSTQGDQMNISQRTRWIKARAALPKGYKLRLEFKPNEKGEKNKFILEDPDGNVMRSSYKINHIEACILLVRDAQGKGSN